MLHYFIGDDMTNYDIWLLFMKTGKIEYYLKYKKLEDKENDKRNRRNNS